MKDLIRPNNISHYWQYYDLNTNNNNTNILK